MCYSNTSAVVGPGLRRCTQNLPTSAFQNQVVGTAGAGPVAECYGSVVHRRRSRAGGLLCPGFGAATRRRHSLGTAARSAGGRARTGTDKAREPTAAGGRNLGLRRFRRRRLRQRGSRTLAEPFGETIVKRISFYCTSADHRSQRRRSWQLHRRAWAASALMAPRSKSFVGCFRRVVPGADYNLANRTAPAHR